MKRIFCSLPGKFIITEKKWKLKKRLILINKIRCNSRWNEYERKEPLCDVQEFHIFFLKDSPQFALSSHCSSLLFIVSFVMFFFKFCWLWCHFNSHFHLIDWLIVWLSLLLPWLSLSSSLPSLLSSSLSISLWYMSVK